MKLPRTISGRVGAIVLGLSLSASGLPLAVAHAQSSPAMAADSAAVNYVDTTYPGSGQANILKTEADTERGVPVYDVRVFAPDGHIYVVHVQQSNDAVLSANLAESQTTGASGQTAQGSSDTNGAQAEQGSSDAHDQGGEKQGVADDHQSGDAHSSGSIVGTSAAAQPASASEGDFTPFWVQAFTPSVTLWSSPDSNAVAFGTEGQWSVFEAVQPQAGPRLYVFNPLTHNYAYVDAVVVGPVGSPATAG